MVASAWDDAAARALVKPYLDPLVAEAKRAEHLALVERWLPDLGERRLLKTDLWEEAVGGDELLFTLADRAREAHGIDVSARVVDEARRRGDGLDLRVADLRAIPLADGAVDAVLSTSTLDHLPTTDAYAQALRELRRVLSPGGVLVASADNSANAFDWLLHLAGRTRFVPFDLGPSVSLDELERLVAGAGFEVTDRAHLVPAPRIVATLAVRAARALRGDRGVEAVLALFARLGRRAPNRMASFVAVRAVRR
jgi:SAM-dependent methyltransferase